MTEPRASILQDLATASSFAEAVDRLIAWARELTGCDAALLRLQEQDVDRPWIPALATSGVPFDFLRDEGLIGGDECLCGQVCSGAASGHRVFTSGGSFACDRLGELTEADFSQLGDLRGRCVTIGFQSLLIVPVPVGEANLGCLHLAAFTPDVFARHQEEVEAVCRLAGPVLAQFSEGEREASVIGAVEAVLMPLDPPALDTLEVAVSYGSATNAAHLGGDLYEIVQLPDGDVLLAVGDYSGRGLSAAGMAARARQAVAAAAALDGAPEAVLAHMQGALGAALTEGRFFTVVVCRYSPDGSLRCAGAGHPWPLVLDASGGAREIALPFNAPLGHWAGAAFDGGDGRLEPDQTLALYTDGITESRQGGHFFGVEGIAEVWRRSAHLPPAGLAAALRQASADFHDSRLIGDDRLVLVARPIRPAP